LDVEVVVLFFEVFLAVPFTDEELVDFVVVEEGLLDDPHAAKVMPAVTISTVAASGRFGLIPTLGNKFFGIVLLLSPVTIWSQVCPDLVHSRVSHKRIGPLARKPDAPGEIYVDGHQNA
jgi:hypothetical protein